jgi:SAM-dependent methyltransferase
MDGYEAETYGERIAGVYDDWYGVKSPDDAVVFLADLADGGPVLELGIGTGRIALPLRGRGVEVHGIDASPAMVAQLRDKPGGDVIDVAIGDFAAVDAPGGPYGLVYVAFNTFFALLTQADQVRCFANVATVLRRGGRFVTELFVPDVTRFDRDQRTSTPRNVIDAVHLEAMRHDLLAQTVSGHHIVLRDGEPVRLFPISLRYAYPAELDLMAQLAGLELEARYDGWNREPLVDVALSAVSVWRKP